jgi:ABC-type Co2+ transport system permease subunit
MRASRFTLRSLLGAALAAWLSAAGSATACAICFGDPNSPLTKSAEMGVWFLLGVIVLVEASFGVFFLVYLRRRARRFHDPVPRPALRLVKKGV